MFLFEYLVSKFELISFLLKHVPSPRVPSLINGNRGWQTFSIRGQTVNIFGFVDLKVLVITT